MCYGVFVDLSMIASRRSRGEEEKRRGGEEEKRRRGEEERRRGGEEEKKRRREEEKKRRGREDNTYNDVQLNLRMTRMTYMLAQTIFPFWGARRRNFAREFL